MRGTVQHQVETLFRDSGINQIGESKHAAKEAVRQEFADMGKSASWNDIGQNTGIFSISTSEDYQAVWGQILDHAKATTGVKDIERLTPEQVASFLESKVEQGVKKSSFDAYAAAAEKLGVTLSWYSDRFDRGKSYSFSAAINPVRAQARTELDKTQEARAYANPRELVANITRPDHQLAGAIQLEAGSRVREASKIKISDLRGLKVDENTGLMMGWYAAKGKGGKNLEKMITPGTYALLEKHIFDSKDKAFRIDGHRYRESLKMAAAASHQKYHGSHGIRWNFAQERYRELQGCGLSALHAMKEVSKEMGHNRIDITMHYLRG